MQSVSVFLDKAKREKNGDIIRTQGVCHVICMFFGSYLGKV